MFSDVRLYFIPVCVIALCTPYFAEAYALNWIYGSSENVTRYRRQAVCGAGRFQCSSGQCINEENQCDGKEDCIDGSDETNACSTLQCHLFRCKYGACVARSAICNGIRDCKDNSDETLPQCSTVVPIGKPDVVPRNCGTGQFSCNSGQCIKEEELCDGVPHCDDTSDETEATCKNLGCPPTTYVCDYGGCVSKKARCNGKQECFDGSDEKGCPGGPTPTSATPKPTVKPPTKPPTDTTPLPTGSCLVPNKPPHGEFTLPNGASGSSISNTIAPFNAIQLKCGRGYGVYPPQANGVSSCIGGKLLPAPATCIRVCPSVHPTTITSIKCTLNGIPQSDCTNPFDGTVATITCAPHYEHISQIPNTRLCRDGTWDYSIGNNVCLPECGIKRPKGQINVIGGQAAQLGDYPWQVGIYTAEKQHICGASIINQRVVLSAAHCFTKPDDGSVYPKENYLIAAGKYYRNYEDERDKYSQYSKIRAIHVPDRYKGISRYYEADIAIVILETKFQITQAVQPVCVDWTNENEYYQLRDGQFGVVTGWGFTQEGAEPSEVLKEISVPYISQDRCYEQVPKTFKKYITYDKLCAGYKDNGTAVCQGDSGGGLTFPNFNEKFYIRGIVSTSPTSLTGSCSKDDYGAYTLLSRHLEFVKEIEIANRS